MKTTIEDIAEELLAAAHKIHKYHIGIAFGEDPPEGFEKGNKEYQHKILETVKPMIDKYNQIKEVNAESSGDVVTLLSKGKVTPQEAIQLLKLIKMKTEVETDEMEIALKKQLMEAVDDD